jgi:type I restriction enzyme, S subunit
MSELPNHWVNTVLSEIASVQMGQSPDSRSYNDKGEGLPFFQGKAEFGKLFPTVRKWCTEPKKIAEEEDILLSVRAPVGPTNLAMEKCCVGRGLASIRATPPFHQKYLLHYLRSIESWLSKQGTGTTFASIDGDFIRNLPVPVAPLKEQRQIAHKLDILIAEVQSCCDLLEQVLISIRDFHNSVITAAIKGDLTTDWMYTDHPEEWQEVVVGDLLLEKPRNGYSPRAVEFQTQTRSLILTATTSGKFNPQHIKYINEIIPENSYLWLEPGDILIQRANTIEYVGVSAIYDGPSKGYIYPDLMMKCRANSRVLTKFLYYLLSSEEMRTHFRKNATGTTGNMPKINQQTIIHAPAWIPCINEQQEIVRRTDSLIAYSDRIKELAQSALEQVKKLTPVILERAFRGELVSQDPSDEPASILLTRIIENTQTSGEDMSKFPNSKLNSISPSRAQPIKLTLENIKSSHLSDILRVEQDFMTAEMLWINSQLEIDDFYEQLKHEEAHGLLKEIKEEASDSHRLLGII